MTFQATGAFAVGTSAARFLARVVRKRSLYDFKRKVVAVTGGSRGLGLEMARAFAEEGALVAICARTEEDIERAVADLRERNAHDVLGVVADVKSRAEIERFIGEIVEKWGRIDVLVNNAGIIQAGPSEHMSREDFHAAMDTHFWGPMNAMEAALPHMRMREQGRIVNICSVGGKIAVPHMLPYCASKFALAGLSEGLRSELSREGIVVTTVFPGLVRTGSPMNATFKGKHREEYAWFSISDSIPLLTIGSRRAAVKIREACRHGRAELVLSAPAKIGVLVRALVPNLTAAVLSGVNRLLPGSGGVGSAPMSGKRSESGWTTSFLTALTRRAAANNNEKDHVEPEAPGFDRISRV